MAVPTQSTSTRRSPFSRRHQLARAAWAVVYITLFRTSPRPLHRWRNWLLRLFGAGLHPTARVYGRARCWAPWNLVMGREACIGDDVDIYCVERIEIGDHATVSQHSHLCGATHDFETVENPVIAAPIVIGRRCWIASGVFIAPGVTIGEGTVVGANSSVMGDLPAWVVAFGVPAKPHRKRLLGPADYGEVS